MGGEPETNSKVKAGIRGQLLADRYMSLLSNKYTCNAANYHTTSYRPMQIGWEDIACLALGAADNI